MASSSRSWKYDVFLSFRGEDTRKNYVDHLYKALSDQLIHTYKDDQTLPRGDSIGPSLLKAIEGSQIAVVVFSENYADSSWCLDELAYIMKCRDERRLMVIPIFYKVDPSDVRKLKGKFGRAFANRKGYNKTNEELWRKAVVDACNISGWEPKNLANGGHYKLIVDTISEKLFTLNSYVNDDLVGMETRLQSLKSQLDIESGGVHMVGIWGVGGSGKTTLAYSAYKKFSNQFQGHCFIDQIREESTKHGLEKLQEKVLSTLLKTDVKVQMVEEGKDMIRSRLSRNNVLIVLDDVDDDSQIEALAGSHKWFGDGSRIIITTRDEHLLKKDKIKISRASLLSHGEAIQLFYRHAVQDDKLIEDYNALSQRVVSYAAGLPLALKVLGSFLRDKDKNEWMSVLAKMNVIPNPTIMDKLKISYDGLEPNDKELFLDIACFHRGERVNQAMQTLDACRFHPGIGIKVLRQKALITISDGRFEMHDLVQEMGHYIVRCQHPYNPEKHSRVWKHKEIVDMCSINSLTEKKNNEIVAIKFNGSSLGFFKLVSNMKKLRLLFVHVTEARDFSVQDVEGPSFLSNELHYIDYAHYPRTPFPANFHPTKLVVLKLQHTLQKQLWQGNKLLPQLKELYLEDAENLIRTPNFDGLPCLKNLKLSRCNSLEELDPSLGYCISLVHVFVSDCEKLRIFPTIVRMKKLETLEIKSCNALLVFPEIQSSMDSLVKLYLRHVGIQVLPSSIGQYCTNLNLLELRDNKYLKRLDGNLLALKQLEKFVFSGSFNLEKPPNELFSVERFLRRLDLSFCGLEEGDIPCEIGELFNLTELNLSGNKFSQLPFGLLQLTKLKVLILGNCYKLLELPEFPSSIVKLIANECYSLQSMSNFYKNCKRLSHVFLFNSNNVTGVEGLLQCMLHGKATDDHYMSLFVDGLEISKAFVPPLLRGSTCRLKLPKNWCNDFCGFLLCAILTKGYMWSPNLCLKHEQGNTMGMDLEPGLWKECNDDKYTWVGYVSFDSLRHTTWWGSISDVVSFSISSLWEEEGMCSGFGVKLVSRKSQSVLTETTTDSSELWDDKDDCMFKIKIELDTKSALEIFLYENDIIVNLMNIASNSRSTMIQSRL